MTRCFEETYGENFVMEMFIDICSLKKLGVKFSGFLVIGIIGKLVKVYRFNTNFKSNYKMVTHNITK